MFRSRSILALLLAGLFLLPAWADSDEAAAAAEPSARGVIRMPRNGPLTAELAAANACSRRCGDALFRCTQRCTSESCRDACLETHRNCEAQCPTASAPKP